MNTKKILIIDDEKEFCSLLKRHLEATREFEACDCFSIDGFEKKGFPSTVSLVDFLEKTKPELIILDLMMPGLNGFEICKILKEEKRFSSISVIIASAKDDSFDKVSGLNIGADDYVVKPICMDELTARIRAVLRRKDSDEKKDIINVAKILVVDLQKHEVLVDENKIELTPVEFMILEFLSSRKNRVSSRAEILDYLWGSSSNVTSRTIDVHIRYLRKKLGRAGNLIKCVRTIGYKLEEA